MKLSHRIGLEIHATILTSEKLFSKSSTKIAPPNTNVSYFDAALPGTLPVLNQSVLPLAIKTGLLLNCSIAKNCTFIRKHYFFHDLPLGYQISQTSNPIASSGFLKLSNKTLDITQIQIEQDSAKTISTNPLLIDLNRNGNAVLEIVTAPNLTTVSEALEAVHSIFNLLSYHDITSPSILFVF